MSLIGGNAGESFLKNAFGGESQVELATSLGKRFVDQIAEGAAHESKVGYVAYSEKAMTQIAKDAEILTNKLGGVKEYTWHFFRSGITHKVGADPRIIEALNKAGIKAVFH